MSVGAGGSARGSADRSRSDTPPPAVNPQRAAADPRPTNPRPAILQRAAADGRAPRDPPPAKPQRTAADGLVVVDKAGGWTSHDVVARLRRLAGTRKVGHAGTLDPMATGVLVAGVGRATRLLTFVVGTAKEYEATIRLGVATTTDDAEGEVTTSAGAAAVTEAAVRAAVADLTGEIMQVPTSVSAIKIDGQRAYALARAGMDVALAARPVAVHRFDLREVRPARIAVRGAITGAIAGGGLPDEDVAPHDVAVLDVDVTVACSAGTYVRALARDLGRALGTGGHLTALRRTRVGPFGLDRAAGLEDLAADVERDGVLATVPLADAARAVLPVRDLSPEEARALSYGQWIAPSGTPQTHAAVSDDGQLIALIEDTRRGGAAAAKPVLVFTPAGNVAP